MVKIPGFGRLPGTLSWRWPATMATWTRRPLWRPVAEGQEPVISGARASCSAGLRVWPARGR
jgi:hypothetical protein